jgi:hypothetical protein
MDLPHLLQVHETDLHLVAMTLLSWLKHLFCQLSLQLAALHETGVRMGA